MSYINRLSTLAVGIPVVVFAIGMTGPSARADETGGKSRFQEHTVEFHNQGVKIAGSLLLPVSERPVPAVLFVHGAGRQTREPYREVGEFFASRGIAALIYDKRGTGQSNGTYESYEPYENLVKDALSAVAYLKQRREIEGSQIGIWGLSQGAYISAAAASRSQDIRFVIGVGASVSDRTDFYYRDNLFRKYGLSEKLRDLAEKAQLVQETLPHNLREESLFDSFLPRSYPPPEKYVHPVWSRVHQPVLVMWGALDQHQPVGESILGLKNSLAQANNDNWTMIILPRAKHSLGISDTGEIQEKWRGYPPGALKTMTDWAWRAIDRPLEIDKMRQVGDAEVKGVLAQAARYEHLRWYGNGTVQAALWILFLISFLTHTFAGIRHSLAHCFRRQQSVALPGSNRAVIFKRSISALNLLILVGMAITVFLVMDQIHPSCPEILMNLPLLGTVSTLATVAFLVVIARTPSDCGSTSGRKIRFTFDLLCLILFVPYLFYWNLIGFHF